MMENPIVMEPGRETLMDTPLLVEPRRATLMETVMLMEGSRATLMGALIPMEPSMIADNVGDSYVEGLEKGDVHGDSGSDE